jgi:hypothetical protein
LDGVSKFGIRVIDAFQPHHVKPESLAKCQLLHLHKLSNRDKHHMLAISTLGAEFAWSFVAADGRVMRTDQTDAPRYDGSILAEMPVKFLIDGERVQLQAKITISVGFNEAPLTGFEVLNCLQRIREFIGKIMLPAFEPFFDRLPDELRLTTHGLTVPPKPVEILILGRINV